MKLLLDTHALLWAVAAPGVLRDSARSAIVDPRNVVLVSAVSQWEISIKRALGKLTFDGDVREHIARSRFTSLPITFDHAAGVEDLPALHRDPFDRMLVAQAQIEQAILVTRDAAVQGYDVATMTA